LLDHGADSKIREEYGFTPYIIMRSKGFTVHPGLVSDETAYHLKRAALVYGLEGEFNLLGKDKLHLEGGDIGIPLSQDIADLKELNTEVRLAFRAVKAERTTEQIVTSIKKGHLTILPVSSEDHWISLVFYQDLLFVCNRGAGGEDGCLRCFKIAPDKMNTFIIKEILQHFSKSTDSLAKYCYQDLPKLLAADNEAHEITPHFHKLEPKHQHVGNCSAASIKLAIRASLAALRYKKCADHLFDKDVSSILEESKSATTHLRSHLYDYLDKLKDTVSDEERARIEEMLRLVKMHKSVSMD
jgi:hypothetical protein